MNLVNKKKYNVLAAAIWYVAGNVLVKGVAFFVLPIFTKLMTTEEYGIFSIYASYLSIVEVIALFGLSSTVRISKYDTNIDYEKYVATIIYVPAALCLAFAIPLNIILAFKGEFLSMNSSLWNYLLSTASIAAISNIVCAKQIIDGKYKLHTLYSISFTLLNAGISIALAYTIFRNHDIHMSRVIGQFISQGIATLLLVVFSKTIRKIDIKYLKQAFIWGMPLLLHTLATVVLTQTDKIVIKYLDGYSSAGIYGVAVTFVAIPLVVYTSFEGAWAPWFYSKINENEYSNIRSFNNIYIIGMAFMVSIFMLAAPTLIMLFTDNAYWESMYSLVPLTASVFFEMTYGICVSVEYFYKKTWYITVGTVAAVAFNIALDVLFVTLWGYIAAAYATVLSKIILFVFHFFISKRINKESMFNILYLFGSIVLIGGTVALSLLFSKTLWVRLIIAFVWLAAFVAIIIKNRESFKDVLGSKKKKENITCEE